MSTIRDVNTEPEVLQEVGRRIKALRLAQNRTLDDVAARAGIGRATLAKLEAGHNATLGTLIRTLRTLGQLEALDDFLPEPTISPLHLLETRGHVRQRPRRRGASPGGDAKGSSTS